MSMEIENQMYKELDAVIRRYAEENEVTVISVVGVIELLKSDVLDDVRNLCTECDNEDNA